MGALWISSDGDDQMIFWRFEIFYSGIFGGWKIWQVFFGWLDLSRNFWGYYTHSKRLW